MSQDRQRPNGDAAGEQQQPTRSRFEWITFGVSLLIVISLAATIVFLYLQGGDEPATIRVSPQWEAIRQEGDLYYLPVKVENAGDRTAASVLVIISLSAGAGQPEQAEFSLDFLSGGAVADAVVTFHTEPTQDNISARATYVEP